MNFWISLFGIATGALLCLTVIDDSKIRHRYYWKKLGKKVIYIIDADIKDFRADENLEKCERYPLICNAYTFGRNPLLCDIAVTKTDGYVSRLSGEIFFSSGSFRIRSVNQELITVFRNGQRAFVKKGQKDALILEDGDLIQIGRTTLLFTSDRRKDK